MSETLRQAFTPEFLGRLDSTVRFEPLTAEAMEAIAGKYLRQLQERAAGLGVQVTFPTELARGFAERCRGKDGARQLRRMIQTEVEGALAGYLLRCSRKPARVKARLENGKVTFSS